MRVPRPTHVSASTVVPNENKKKKVAGNNNVPCSSMYIIFFFSTFSASRRVNVLRTGLCDLGSTTDTSCA